MLRPKGFKPKPKVINIVLMNGGVGDHMASLVAIDYILKNYTWIRPLVWMPDFLVSFAKHILPKNLHIRGYTDMALHYSPEKPTKTTAWDGVISPMKMHCLDYAFMKLCDENPPMFKKNYLQVRLDDIDTSKFDLPEKYIVVTAGFTAEVRELLPEAINKIADYALSKGYTPVYLGQTATATGAAYVIKGTFREEIDFSKGLNLIDKTNLLEAAKIMGQSKAVLGVDNGLLHVAGCTDASIIGGFTTVNPELRMPVRHGCLGWNYIAIEPDEDLACKFCQVKTNFLYDHNYINCLYKDNLCTKQMTAEKFIKALEGVINES